MNGGSHPDLELLSDLWAGALPASEADELERHLEHCSICSGRVDSLVEVHGTLRMVGADRPSMPADVTARLTAAIRDEAGIAAAPEDFAATQAAGSGAAGAARAGGAAGSGGAAGAGEGGGALPEAADGSGRDTRHVARSGRDHAARGHAGRGRASRGRRRDGRPGRAGRARVRFGRALAVAAGVAVLAVGGTVAYQAFLSESAGQSPSASEQRDGRERTGPDDQQTYALTDRRLDLTEQDFDGQVRQVVVPGDAATPRTGPGSTDNPGVTGGERPDTGSNPPDANGEPGGDVGALSQPDRCVQQTLARQAGSDAGQVLDVGEARFDDQPAMLVITPGPRAGVVHAWAIVGCPGQGSVAYDAQVPVDG